MIKKLLLTGIILLSLSTFVFGAGEVTLDQASDIETDTTNFNHNLSSNDNTTQKALDTIDNLNVSGTSTTGFTRSSPYVYLTTITDNVGIGTTSPSAKLDIVNGYEIITNDYPAIELYLTDATCYSTFWSENDIGEGGGISVNGSNNSGADLSNISNQTIIQASASSGLQLQAYGGNGYLSFTTGGDALSNERMRITGLGNVGIGTTAPVSLLDVNSKFNVLSGGNVGIGSTIPTAKLDVNGPVKSTAFSTTGGYTQTGTTTNTFTGTPTFSNATYSALFTGGNVGIGTTAPGGLLHLYNYAIASSLIINPGASANVTTNESSILVTKETGAAYPFLEQGNLVLTSRNNTGQRRDIVFMTNDGSAMATRMVIDRNGNVGIGTTAPVNLLDVGSNTTGGNVKIYATLGNEMAPALEAANWTCTDGWSAGSGALTKITGADVGTATPSGTFTVVGGTTYKVVITCSAVANSCTYTLGGVSGTTVTVTTITDYITAITNAKIIFSGNANATATITSVSVKALTDATGDLTIQGNLTLNSPAYFIGGNVGIGTLSPAEKLDVRGTLLISSTGTTLLNFTSAGGVSDRTILSASGSGTFLYAADTDSTDGIHFRASGGSTDLMYIGGGSSYLNRVGIRTTGPDRALEVNDASGNCLRLTYNDSDGSAANYADFLVSSGGNLTITPSGGTLSTGAGITFTAIAKGIILKQGANGKCGTFILNGITPVTVSNTSVAITDTIIFSLNTVGGTVGAYPVIQTITAATGFTVSGTALDTSTYNYVIISNAP